MSREKVVYVGCMRRGGGLCVGRKKVVYVGCVRRGGGLCVGREKGHVESYVYVCVWARGRGVSECGETSANQRTSPSCGM